jgi:arylsulfatase
MAHPMAAAAGAFLKTLAMEPPIKPGTPDPYAPPRPGELIAHEHLQIGQITQFVTTLQHQNGRGRDIRQHQPGHGLARTRGA